MPSDSRNYFGFVVDELFELLNNGLYFFPRRQFTEHEAGYDVLDLCCHATVVTKTKFYETTSVWYIQARPLKNQHNFLQSIDISQQTSNTLKGLHEFCCGKSVNISDCWAFSLFETVTGSLITNDFVVCTSSENSPTTKPK